MDEVDLWAIYDNSEYKREKIATGGKTISMAIYDTDKLNQIKSKAMSNKEAQEFFHKLDNGLALAEQEMLRDKASRGESIVYSDKDGNIKHALASDVLAGKIHG